MSALSPAAQAVLDAADSTFDQAGTVRQGIAAALRAAADQVDAVDVPVCIQGDSYWPYRNGQNAAAEYLRAIGAELERGQDKQPTERTS